VTVTRRVLGNATDPSVTVTGASVQVLTVLIGIVTVPVQDGWADGRTDNRPVPSLGCRSPQHPVPSPDGGEDGRPVHLKTDDGRMDGYNALPRHLTSATNLGAVRTPSRCGSADVCIHQRRRLQR
jgi:hypothetical protein